MKKDAPNQRSSNNVPLIYFVGIVAAALPEVLRYAAQFVTLFPPPSFVRAALVSFIPLRSFRPPFRSIAPVRTHVFCFKPWHTNPATWPQHKCAHVFRKACPTILTGFHFAPLQPSFTSVAFSPPAAFCCCARLAATGCVPGRRWHRTYAHKLAYATLCPFTVCPSLPAVALLATPAGGTRRQFRRDLLYCLWASSPATVWTSVPHGYTSFWPQALLPFSRSNPSLP